MPRARPFDKYPDQFKKVMVDAVHQKGVTIGFPSLTAARNFRARLYAYRRDLAAALQTETDSYELEVLTSLHSHISSLSFFISRTEDGAELLLARREDVDPAFSATPFHR